MADKSVVVRLRAEIGQYQAELAKAASSTRTLGKELTGAGKTGRADLDNLGRGALLMGGVMLAGFGAAANAAMGFDKQLSELAAVSSATGAEMSALRQQALDAGAATVFSAAEAAQAQTELAKAGVSTADIMGGALTGALDLAAAGSIGLAQAAEIAASAMTTFGLSGGDVGRIADSLAAGANKSAADVDDMAQALAQSGLVADQFGLTLEETVGTLSMFAQRGLKGSDAGTSFKTMLQRLVPVSKEASAKMAELGIDMFDAQGNFVGVAGAADELKDGLSRLTQEQRNNALAVMFGSDAVRAATIFYQGGAEEVDRWTEAVSDAGFAGDVAATKLDNLAGDLEALKGSIETALIEGGTHANGTLRFMVQGATDAVNAFAELPGPIQAAGTGLAAFGGAGVVATGAMVTLIPRIHDGLSALQGMGPAGVTAARGLSGLGRMAGAAGGIAAGLGLLIIVIDQVADAMTENAPDVDLMGAALVGLAKDAVVAGELASTFGDDLAGLGDDLDLLMDRRSGFHLDFAADFDEAVGRIDSVDQALAQLVASGHADMAAQLMQAMQDTLTGEAWAQFPIELNDYTDALVTAESQSKLTGDATADMGSDFGVSAEEIEAATDALKAHQDQLRAAVDPIFAMVNAADANRTAQIELAEALADGETSADDLARAQQQVAESAFDGADVEGGGPHRLRGGVQGRLRRHVHR
ncbi:MAG: phage tail tape measure protein [Acidimicrobiales bacterium]